MLVKTCHADPDPRECSVPAIKERVGTSDTAVRFRGTSSELMLVISLTKLT